MAGDMKNSYKTTKTGKIKIVFLPLVFCMFLFLASTVITKPAVACCSCSSNCSCIIRNHGSCGGGGTRGVICTQHELTEDHITREFQKHQRWIFNTFFHSKILPAWMKLTEQLSAIGMQQVQIIGAFLDAKQQLEIQRMLQKKEAEAHRDYHPDVELCTIGTSTKSLAATERRGEYYTLFLTEYSQDRQLGNENSNAAEGLAADRINRVRQFTNMFCDVNDNNMGLMPMCGPISWTKQQNFSKNSNKDIDYTRLIDMSRTLDVDYTATFLTDDAQAVLSMHDYLFSHDVFDRPTESQIRIKDNQDDYYDLRSVVAKRSVAENSFNTIVGLKSKGATATGNGYYFALLLQQLGGQSGISYTDALKMIGSGRPSYFATMEVMAKKIYQHPDFYINLYGKPANVRRKEVALQAVDLMLGRDMYKSDLRSEALLAVLLEMELSRYQEELQSQMEVQINYNYGMGK